MPTFFAHCASASLAFSEQVKAFSVLGHCLHSSLCLEDSSPRQVPPEFRILAQLNSSLLLSFSIKSIFFITLGTCEVICFIYLFPLYLFSII